MTHRILLSGGTGLVGRLVCHRLEATPDIDLVSLVRREATGQGTVIDFEKLVERPELVMRALAPDGLDVSVCCLGTTIRASGSQRAMFRIDHDYVLAIARGALALGARQFILVTAVGAGGPGFYLKTKGAIERAVTDLGFERVDFIRPGVLLGNRGERRFWEGISQRVFAAIAPLLRGALSRYGAISADTVAQAIVALVGVEKAGCYRHENADLLRLSKAK